MTAKRKTRTCRLAVASIVIAIAAICLMVLCMIFTVLPFTSLRFLPRHCTEMCSFAVFCTSVISSIAAIIFSILARRRITQSQLHLKGKGLTTAGFLTAFAMLFCVPFLVIMRNEILEAMLEFLLYVDFRF